MDQDLIFESVYDVKFYYYQGVDTNNSVHLKTFYTSILPKEYKVHPTNVDTLSNKNLKFVIGILQAHGAPVYGERPVSPWRVVVDQSSFGTKTYAQVVDLLPNSIIIAPSTVPNVGLGAFAWHDISTGQELGVCSGTPIEHEKRAKQLAEQGNNYIFGVYRVSTESIRFVVAYDAKQKEDKYDTLGRKYLHKGTWPRYVNEHSKKYPSNTRFEIVEPYNKKDVHKYKIVLYSTALIVKGSELFVDYNGSKL